MSFFTGFLTSSLIYFLLNWAFPARGKASKWGEIDVSLEDVVPEAETESIEDKKSVKAGKRDASTQEA